MRLGGGGLAGRGAEQGRNDDRRMDVRKKEKGRSARTPMLDDEDDYDDDDDNRVVPWNHSDFLPGPKHAAKFPIVRERGEIIRDFPNSRCI